MRERLLRRFDTIWLDCMNGDSRETGKLTPEGMPDPSVFSTERNREESAVGTAISTLVRKEGDYDREAAVAFRSFWGTTKRADLLASLDLKDCGDNYQQLKSKADTRYVLRPSLRRADYGEWIAIDSLFRRPPFPGLLEKRGSGLIDLDREALKRKITGYLDPTLSFEEARNANPALATNRSGYDAKRARPGMLANGVSQNDFKRSPYPAKAGCAISAGSRRTRLAPPGMVPVLS